MNFEFRSTVEYCKSILIVAQLFVFIALSGCGGEGYRDEARLGQAKRSLNRIKNSLEQYWVETGSYPPEGAELRNYLGNYVEEWDVFIIESFSSEPSYYTPDSLRAYLVEVTAKDRLNTPLVIRSHREPKEVEEDTNETKK